MRTPVKIAAILFVATIAGTQTMQSTIAQLDGLSTATCTDKRAAFQEAVTTETFSDLKWVYDGVLNDILDPECTVAGAIQGVGYVTDPELLIDPNVQEQMYYVPESNLFLVTFLEKQSISYAFNINIPVMPDEYIQMKNEELLNVVAIGKELHSVPEEISSETSSEAETLSSENQEISSAVSTEGALNTVSDEVSSESSIEAEISSSENQDDLFAQIEEMEQLSSSSSSARAFFREGKIVRSGVRDSGTETERPSAPDNTDTEEEAEIEELDPLLQQLLDEQEELIAQMEENGGVIDETDEELENTDNGVDEQDQKQEQTPESDSTVQGGMDLTTMIAGGAAVIFGIGFTFFMLMRKKKGKGKEDAPPTAQMVASTPQQKSNRLEEALAEMDETKPQAPTS